MHPVPAHATGEIVGDVLEAVGPSPTLAVLFVTHPLTGTFDDVVGAVQQMLQPSHLVAITTGGVLGCGSEVEDGSALALWAVQGGSVETFLLPGTPFSADSTTDVEHSVLQCSDNSSGLVLLADADSFDVTGWLSAQNPPLAKAGARFAGPSRSRPATGQLGWIPPAQRLTEVSAGGLGRRARATPNVLFRNGTKVTGGALAVAFGPEFVMHTLVSQSCRPIGKPFTVTKAERTVLYAMGGHSASGALDLTVELCDDTERTLLRQGIHLGVVVNGGFGVRRDLANPFLAQPRDDVVGIQGAGRKLADGVVQEFEMGDFVVHQVLGSDRSAGAIALSGACEIGDVVQFQVKDSVAARSEYQQRMVEAFAPHRPVALPTAYGALLFASATRGAALFGTEHHDAAAAGEYSAMASAGAFCSTQLGPVGDLYGQHQSALTMALLRAAD